ncbi:hypothetical protein H6F89_29845 [Cyanobacteria bacterium FACHB-63]|nr:hypothetical protein [Cyanobacteria bacterium FACHB-63]
MLQHCQAQIAALTREWETLLRDRLHLCQRLIDADAHLSDRHRQLETLRAEMSQLQQDKQLLEVSLNARLNQGQEALERTQIRLLEKRHELAVHPDAIETQILNIWNLLYAELIAICDRFDPSHPASDLDYAGKVVILNENKRRQWNHYRRSLTSYDTGLRERMSRMSQTEAQQKAITGFDHLQILDSYYRSAYLARIVP